MMGTHGLANADWVAVWFTWWLYARQCEKQDTNITGKMTYNSNERMSLGEAVTLAGLKVSSPFEPPTTTLITLGETEDGVGSGEPGYDE